MDFIHTTSPFDDSSWAAYLAFFAILVVVAMVLRIGVGRDQ